jgi:single-strand DNA-binding protein
MFNKAILIGRLTAEPELKQTQSGVSVTQFTIACDRRFKNKNGEKQADFITIVAWRQAAEFIVKYFGKGDPIGIEGSIQTRNYEDKQGQKRTAFEVVADNVFFVGNKREKAEEDYSQESPAGFEEVSYDGDLPF